MPTLTYITEEAKLPIICGESGPVHNGGLANVGIDYYKLGFQTGEMAQIFYMAKQSLLKCRFKHKKILRLQSI